MLLNHNSLARKWQQSSFSAHSLHAVTLMLLLLSSVSLLCITMADAAPTRLIPRRSPVISAVLGGREGLSIGIGATAGDSNGGGSLLHLHRPIFNRADEAEWPQKEKRRLTVDKRVVHNLGSKSMDRVSASHLHRGDIKPQTAKPSTDHPGIEKRRVHSNMQRYVPCGPGSGVTYDKGQPYGR